MIFIIGGEGFVGSGFARTCREQGRDYIVINRTNYADHVGRSCDILVNANGNSKKFLSRDEPVADFRASVESVRASLVDFRFDTYLHLSSCDVYPDCSSPATTAEDQRLDVARQSPYGFHKFLAEQCVQHGAARWLVLRLGGFVGPGMKKNAIFDILQGGPLWLDRESRLQFMHTDDMARLALDLVDQSASCDVFNLCGRGLVSLSEVEKWAGRPVEVKPQSPRPTYEVDIAKVSGIVDVPSTRDVVQKFVRGQVEAAER